MDGPGAAVSPSRASRALRAMSGAERELTKPRW